MLRWFYIAIIVVLTIAVLSFKFQNLENVTLSFLSMKAEMPVAVLVFLVYFLGMVSGGALLALLRGILRRTAPKHH
jgi:uncharacterized integral membrane protein